VADTGWEREFKDPISLIDGRAVHAGRGGVHHEPSGFGEKKAALANRRWDPADGGGRSRATDAGPDRDAEGIESREAVRDKLPGRKLVKRSRIAT
jgi:hypothetical protein